MFSAITFNTNGLAEFKNDGEFFGFFGGNRLPNTFENIVKSLLFDENQRRKLALMASYLPTIYQQHKPS